MDYNYWNNKKKQILSILDKELKARKQNIPTSEKDKLARDIIDIATTPGDITSDFFSNGPAIVIPLFVAHAISCNPQCREWMLQVCPIGFGKPIMDELVSFIKGATSKSQIKSWEDNNFNSDLEKAYACARYTAFQVLIDRAKRGREDKLAVVKFIQTLKRDKDDRIKKECDSAMNEIMNVGSNMMPRSSMRDER